MKLYMVVTNDKYELPVAVSEKRVEIAKMTGMALSSVCNAFARADRTKRPTGKYKYVIVEEGENHEID